MTSLWSEEELIGVEWTPDDHLGKNLFGSAFKKYKKHPNSTYNLDVIRRLQKKLHLGGISLERDNEIKARITELSKSPYDEYEKPDYLGFLVNEWD